MQIKVLGPGCNNCKKLYKMVEEALQELSLEAEVLYVTDMADIAKAGIMRTPGLIIDGAVKVSGRLPKPNEVKDLLKASSGA